MSSAKSEIRAEAKRRISALSAEQQQTLARLAGEEGFRCLESLGLKDGTPVGLFLSMKGKEIETRPLIERLRETGRYAILVPRVEEDGVTMNFYPYLEEAPHHISRYGIWEPDAPCSAAVVPEVIIVPGLAFDRNGGRVGHGKGFYDRYFARHAGAIARKIGYAYSVQLFDEVPMDDFDRPLDTLVTDTGIYTRS